MKRTYHRCQLPLAHDSNRAQSIAVYPETGKIGNPKICFDPDMGMRFSCKRSHSMFEYLSAGRHHKMKVR